MQRFEHIPHPHVRARRQTGPTKTADGATTMGARVGLLITTAVGTMTCAVAFTVLALVSLPAAISSASLIILVGWIAQTFLQLVLLPIIIVGQRVQGDAADKRSEQTYQDAEAILHECQQLQSHLATQDSALTTLISHVESILGALPKPS